MEFVYKLGVLDVLSVDGQDTGTVRVHLGVFGTAVGPGFSILLLRESFTRVQLAGAACTLGGAFLMGSQKSVEVTETAAG